jgi:hypothetical protein
MRHTTHALSQQPLKLTQWHLFSHGHFSHTIIAWGLVISPWTPFAALACTPNFIKNERCCGCAPTSSHQAITNVGGKHWCGSVLVGDVINHGKQDLWSPNQSMHHHATLKAGEPTLEVQLARVLMKSIVATNGKFDDDHIREAYIKFMTTPGSHDDTCAFTCHCMFFANLIIHKKPPKDCPDNDKRNASKLCCPLDATVVNICFSKPQLTCNMCESPTGQCC